MDPETGDYPEDLFAGFLPPYNEDTGYELGWVEFVVKAKSDLPTGTVIANQAFVEFDFAGDIQDHPAPKEGPYENRTDAGVPTSSVNALSTESPRQFEVTWAGTDEDGAGSGIRCYDIYVSEDGGPYGVWQNCTDEEGALFEGRAGHRYAFYSIAVDGVGHREAAPEHADASTMVQGLLEVTVSLTRGFNLFSYPVEPVGEEVTETDLAALLDQGEGYLQALWRYDSEVGKYIDRSQSEEPVTAGIGYLVYMGEAVTDLAFEGEPGCGPVSLKAGFNLIGFACPADGYSAYQLLTVLGNGNVSSIQRYSTETGAFETAGFGPDGQVVGIDFPIVAGEGYFVFMKQPVSDFGY